MKIEVLNPGEWTLVPEEATRIAEETPLTPQHAIVLAAREGEEIVAVAGLQRVVYAIPFWVKKEFRGNGLSVELARACAFMAPRGQHSLMVTTNAHMEAIAWKVGMTPLSGKLWVREAKGYGQEK